MNADFLPREQPVPGLGGGAAAGATPDAFREFMSCYFTGVTIITSVDERGRPHGLTCNSLTSVTVSPPTLLVSLNVRSGTLDAVRSGSGFVVNLLHDRGRRAAELFASRTADRFDQVAWRPSPRLGLPWLVEDAYAGAECEVGRTMAVGDHVLVIGHVLAVEGEPGSPLLYGMRTFSRALAEPGT